MVSLENRRWGFSNSSLVLAALVSKKFCEHLFFPFIISLNSGVIREYFTTALSTCSWIEPLATKEKSKHLITCGGCVCC